MKAMKFILNAVLLLWIMAAFLLMCNENEDLSIGQFFMSKLIAITAFVGGCLAYMALDKRKLV